MKATIELPILVVISLKCIEEAAIDKELPWLWTIENREKLQCLKEFGAVERIGFEERWRLTAVGKLLYKEIKKSDTEKVKEITITVENKGTEPHSFYLFGFLHDPNFGNPVDIAVTCAPMTYGEILHAISVDPLRVINVFSENPLRLDVIDYTWTPEGKYLGSFTTLTKLPAQPNELRIDRGKKIMNNDCWKLKPGQKIELFFKLL